jgi:hypothetical protein
MKLKTNEDYTWKKIKKWKEWKEWRPKWKKQDMTN